jgi:hypothetical protein
LRPINKLLLILVLATAATACDESLSEIGPTPDPNPTFSSIQRDIFETTDANGREACVTCHTNIGRVPDGDLVLLASSSYAQLVNVSSVQRPGVVNRVTPGNPDASYLVQKVAGTPGIIGLRMPSSGPPYLTNTQISTIRRWIELGAPNN